MCIPCEFHAHGMCISFALCTGVFNGYAIYCFTFMLDCDAAAGNAQYQHAPWPCPVPVACPVPCPIQVPYHVYAMGITRMCIPCECHVYAMGITCVLHVIVMCIHGHVYAIGITCEFHVNAMCMPRVCHVHFICNVYNVQVRSRGMPSDVSKLLIYLSPRDPETPAGHAQSQVPWRCPVPCQVPCPIQVPCPCPVQVPCPVTMPMSHANP
jgi:hypothetical protein